MCLLSIKFWRFWLINWDFSWKKKTLYILEDYQNISGEEMPANLLGKISKLVSGSFCFKTETFVQRKSLATMGKIKCQKKNLSVRVNFEKTNLRDWFINYFLLLAVFLLFLSFLFTFFYTIEYNLSSASKSSENCILKTTISLFSSLWLCVKPLFMA